MKKIRIFFVATLTVILVMAAIGFSITRGKPKITVDYIVEYNKISQPENYDPCQNAADLCNEAYNSFVQKPGKLQKYAEWPDDFNNAEQDLLRKWLNENVISLQKFRIATQKPYFWVKGFSPNNYLLNVKFPEWTYSLDDLCDAISWSAKINAAEGKYEKAFEDVLTCYHAGFQKCNSPCFMIEMLKSMSQQELALRTASLILNNTQVPPFILNSLQKELERISNTQTCFFDFSAEKLFLYEVLQRTYVYKPDGSGRLSWKHKSAFYTMCDGDNPWRIVLNCFAGPSQKEIKNQIDSHYDKLTAAFTITPWQLHQTEPDFFDKLLFDCQHEMSIFYVYGSDYRRQYYGCYNIQTQSKALITTIAIMRFRQDAGHLPKDLDELVKTGYLQQLPIDPYSNKPLVYSVQGEDFKIYSIGSNFKDDDGNKRTDDIVFWPPWQRQKVVDHNLTVQDANKAR